MNKIINLLGSPTSEDLKDMQVSNEALNYLSKLEKKEKANFKQVFENIPNDCLDLISKMLVYSPKKRITADEALLHPFFIDLYDEEDDKTAKLFDFSFEKSIKTTEDVQKMIFEEILKLHPNKEKVTEHGLKKKEETFDKSPMKED